MSYGTRWCFSYAPNLGFAAAHAIVEAMEQKEKRYRSAVSALVLKPVEVCVPGGECATIHQILLLHKPRIHDAWQLPQGGVEVGETIEQAAAREVQEEAGLKLGEVLLSSCHSYSYDFPPEFVQRYNPINTGQKLCFVAFCTEKDIVVQVDRNEVDAYVWVLPEQLPQYITRKAYLDVIHEVLKECEQKLGA